MILNTDEHLIVRKLRYPGGTYQYVLARSLESRLGGALNILLTVALVTGV